MRLRLFLVLFGLWLCQWAYLAVVGLPSGLWDISYTHAEKSLGPRPPYPPASLDAYREAARRAEQLTPEDGRLGRTYHDLGTLLWFMGRNNEARLYLTRALRIFERVDGTRSTWVGITRARLGEMDLRSGKLGEAVFNLQRADAILVRTVGRLDPVALRVASLVASQTHDRARAKEVLDAYQLAGVMPDPLLRMQLEQLIR
ncbi:MAG: tetratricopeptide repeat protein [Candidatus Eremiobacteraeota bacterium]|nr:tetratricopeptide repeat protein [Candidatus Eremiobacteraeota bacterium]MCW5870473.1 tetratricopeptide repeat protein [Candidatus Eremiobacteraeota bacterium]